MHIASLPPEADISTKQFRHSAIPTKTTPMLTKTPPGMNVAVDWMVLGNVLGIEHLTRTNNNKRVGDGCGLGLSG